MGCSPQPSRRGRATPTVGRGCPTTPHPSFGRARPAPPAAITHAPPRGCFASHPCGAFVPCSPFVFASHTSGGKPPNSISPQATHGGRESPLLGSLTIRHYGGKPLRLQAVGAACFSPWCRSASLRSRGIPAACLPPFGLCVGRLASLLILAHPPVPPWLPASGLCPEARSPPPPSRPSGAARGALPFLENMSDRLFPFCFSGAHCRPRTPASVFHSLFCKLDLTKPLIW